MKKLIGLVLAFTIIGCSAAQKQIEHEGVAIAEQACADAIALGVTDIAPECAGLTITAPLINAVIDARKAPEAAKARMMARKAAR